MQPLALMPAADTAHFVHKDHLLLLRIGAQMERVQVRRLIPREQIGRAQLADELRALVEVVLRLIACASQTTFAATGERRSAPLSHHKIQGGIQVRAARPRVC